MSVRRSFEGTLGCLVHAECPVRNVHLRTASYRSTAEGVVTDNSAGRVGHRGWLCATFMKDNTRQNKISLPLGSTVFPQGRLPTETVVSLLGGLSGASASFRGCIIWQT